MVSGGGNRTKFTAVDHPPLNVGYRRFLEGGGSPHHPYKRGGSPARRARSCAGTKSCAVTCHCQTGIGGSWSPRGRGRQQGVEVRKLLFQLCLGFLHTPITAAFRERHPVEGERISPRRIRPPATRERVQSSVDFAIQHMCLHAIWSKTPGVQSPGKTDGGDCGTPLPHRRQE